MSSDEITTQDILAQYGPQEPAKPKDEEGFLFSTKNGQLQFNPWESLKSFMRSGHSPGYLSTSGNDQPIRDAFDTAGWTAMPGMGLNAVGAMAPGGVKAAGSTLLAAGAKLPKTAAVVERELDPLGFYSAALEGAKSWPMERGSPQQALAHLKKSGTKDAEITATGLDKYLAEQDVVSRQALENYLRENRVKVQEQLYHPGEHNVHRLSDDAVMRGPFSTEEEARRAVRDFAYRPRDGYYVKSGLPEGTKAAKWQNYALDPNNADYRERVMYLDNAPKRLAEIEAEMKALQPQIHDAAIDKTRMPEYRALRERQDALHAEYQAARDAYQSGTFKSGHWSEPNAVVHTRTSVLPDEHGGRTFLIDELQSDWGQKLREGGMRDEAKIADLRRRRDELNVIPMQERVLDMAAAAGFDARGHNGNHDPFKVEAFLKSGTPEAAQAAAIVDDIMRKTEQFKLLDAELRTAEASTPGHPLVNTTDQWTTTGIRRLLQQAAEADAAGIALTPGQLQNERFDLAKHITALEYRDNGNGTYYLSGDVGAGTRRHGHDFGNYTAEQLPGVVGKELAAKILAGEGKVSGLYGEDKGKKVLEGLDLEVGGSGMRYAYDQMYPKKIAKELKKLDPNHPGVTQRRLQATDNMEVPKRREIGKEPIIDMPFNYFELTPRAKEEIKKGLPLFQHGLPVADLLHAYYGDDKE